MHVDSSWAINNGRNLLLLIKSIILAALALLGTPIGVSLRFIGNRIQAKPFIYWQGGASEGKV